MFLVSDLKIMNLISFYFSFYFLVSLIFLLIVIFPYLGLAKGSGVTTVTKLVTYVTVIVTASYNMKKDIKGSGRIMLYTITIRRYNFFTVRTLQQVYGACNPI